MAFHALADYQNHVIGWLQWEQSSLGDGAVVRFPRIWMSSGECRLNWVGLEALLIASVLFGLLWLIHSKANTVLIAMFGGIFVGIFFLPFFPNVQEFAETQPPDSAKTANLPIYVHIVLDESTTKSTSRKPSSRAQRICILTMGFGYSGALIVSIVTLKVHYLPP